MRVFVEHSLITMDALFKIKQLSIIYIILLYITNNVFNFCRKQTRQTPHAARLVFFG